MKHKLSFFLLCFFGITLYCFSQQQYSIIAETDYDATVSRDQLNIFTYYDLDPTARAVRFLFDTSKNPGLYAGMTTLLNPNFESIGERKSFVFGHPNVTYVREGGTELSLGWRRLGTDSFSIDFETHYLIMPLLNSIFEKEATQPRSGKNSLSLNFFNTLQIGGKMIDKDNKLSYAANCNLLRVPERLSGSQVNLFKSGVVLFDASLISLFAEYGLTREEMKYSSINFITPFPFIPFIYYDNFVGDNTSYLTFSLAPMPFGIDMLITPRYQIHDNQWQSLKFSVEIFSLFSKNVRAMNKLNGYPLNRARNEEGNFDTLGGANLSITRLFYDPYTGDRTDSTVIDFTISMFIVDTFNNPEKKNDYTIAASGFFEYDFSTELLSYGAGGRFYF